MAYYITNSGRRIDLKNISSADICIEDIAHHLTKICRYGGSLGLGQHYSVAQHSILLASYARDERYSLVVQRALLMHDATEAYLGDIVSGLKELLPDYRRIERKVADIINLKYGIVSRPDVNKTVKELDTRILLDEAKEFMPHYYNHFSEQLPGLEPLGVFPTNELLYERYELSIYKLFLGWCNLLDIKD